MVYWEGDITLVSREGGVPVSYFGAKAVSDRRKIMRRSLVSGDSEDMKPRECFWKL